MTNFWYNMSAINGDNGVLGLALTVDQVFFFHLFGTMILITLFVIIFRATLTYNNNPRVSFLYTTFFIAILAILFRVLSLIGDNTIYVCIGAFLIAIVLQFVLE